MNELVFVYGTLQHGKRNHHFMEGTEYVGKAETADSIYTKIRVWEDIPGVIKNGKDVIKGELYSVPKEIMPALDYLESNGELYQREKIRVICDGIIQYAWLYFYLE